MADLNRLKVVFNAGEEPEFVEHLRIECGKGGIWYMSVTRDGYIGEDTVTFEIKNSGFTIESRDGKPIEFDFDGYLQDQIEQLERACILSMQVRIAEKSVSLVYTEDSASGQVNFIREIANAAINMY